MITQVILFVTVALILVALVLLRNNLMRLNRKINDVSDANDVRLDGLNKVVYSHRQSQESMADTLKKFVNNETRDIQIQVDKWVNYLKTVFDLDLSVYCYIDKDFPGIFPTKSGNASGYDIYTNLKKLNDSIAKGIVSLPRGCTIVPVDNKLVLVMAPNSTICIPTGLHFILNDNVDIQMVPKSGKSLKTSIRLANSPGTIDSDYTGDVSIIVHNNSNMILRIEDESAIAQLIFRVKDDITIYKNLISEEDFIELSQKANVTRGDKGMGSSTKATDAITPADNPVINTIPIIQCVNNNVSDFVNKSLEEAASKLNPHSLPAHFVYKGEVYLMFHKDAPINRLTSLIDAGSTIRTVIVDNNNEVAVNIGKFPRR